MKAWSITVLGLFGLSAATAVSCADLRDSDPCYRVAHLICEKGCAPDQTACIGSIREKCRNPSYELADTTSDASHCADALESKSSCLSRDAITEACAAAVSDFGDLVELSSTMQGTADLSDPCTTGGDCKAGMCSADNGGTCRAPCGGSVVCGAGYSCKSWPVRPSGESYTLCLPDTVPAASPDAGTKPARLGKAPGQPCSSTSECDLSTSTICAGVCTKLCSTNSSCSGAFANGPAVCAKPYGLTNTYCQPGCSTSANCPGSLVCGSTTTADGTTARVCGSSLTSTQPTCADTCAYAHNGTCDDVSNPYGMTTRCAAGTDCSDCKNATATPPASAGSKLGAACSGTGGCAAGLTCTLGWCAAQCTSASNCPAASNGNDVACAGGMCLPTCFYDSECTSGSCAFSAAVEDYVCVPPAVTTTQ